MTEAVLGIDIGTSGVRIVARGRNGELLAMASVPIAAPVLNVGHALQNPQLWWDGVASAFAALKLDGLRILALAIDGTSGSIVAVNDDGVPVGMGSMYNDVAEARFVKDIAAHAPETTAAKGATSPLARAIPLQNSAARILHQADWLLGRMCGRFDVTDENNALKSGYDPVQRCWPAWLQVVGMDARKFPEVVAAGEQVGTILPFVAEQFGLPSDLAVVAGTTDGCAAFLASGAVLAGDGATSLGTTLTLKLLSATPIFAPAFGIYSHRIGDQWLAGGASNSGGAAVAAHFSRDEIVRLTRLINPQVSTGFDYYPLPRAGERFPTNDPLMQPRTDPRPPEDHLFLQGLFEGIAAIEVAGYQKLAALGASPLVSIRSAGGGATNDVWTTIRARMLNVPTLPSQSAHAAMGTARLAWRGIGHED